MDDSASACAEGLHFSAFHFLLQLWLRIMNLVPMWFSLLTLVLPIPTSQCITISTIDDNNVEGPHIFTVGIEAVSLLPV